MKLAAIALCIALAACATHAAGPAARSTTVVDDAKIAAVETHAMARGVTVIWVHTPTKQVPAP